MVGEEEAGEEGVVMAVAEVVVGDMTKLLAVMIRITSAMVFQEVTTGPQRKGMVENPLKVVVVAEVVLTMEMLLRGSGPEEYMNIRVGLDSGNGNGYLPFFNILLIVAFNTWCDN